MTIYWSQVPIQYFIPFLHEGLEVHFEKEMLDDKLRLKSNRILLMKSYLKSESNEATNIG